MKPNATKERFIALYKAEADAVFRCCIFRTSDREVALDITQDAFMRMWDAFAAGKVIDNERAFLFTIARNLIIDWYRKKKPQSLDALIEAGESESFFPPRLGQKEEQELDAEARFLVTKISLLAPPYRQAVYLRFVEDLKPKEIARILGESANTISARLTRGMDKLRELMRASRELLT